MVLLAVGFLFCPCHLPITLAVLSAGFAGTAASAIVRDHGLVVGLAMTAAWLVITWLGFRLLRSRARS
jgi:hypothetical protein